MAQSKKHPLYYIWSSMKDRCRNPNSSGWERYGGRGISVCEEWNDFKTFVRDMGERPSKAHTLDRIDNNLGYSKENCRWATNLEQQRNQERTRRVAIEGVEYLVCELHHLSGLKHDTIVMRAAKGMSYEDVIRKTRYAFSGGVRAAIQKRVENQRLATHCKRGHEWTPENTAIQAGGRYCRACDNLRARLKNSGKSIRTAAGVGVP